ncbi:ferritin [Gordonia liuliyuniae]|uniref:Ferritin n=1 Tax=Gordonia liuliyuniae TaxID=2911517 RepID=A0ABS9ISB2_9ACTN|nr:ferritin [Gordonia liuliyuniae]MCF8588450.1 ferritin [Gordonia liuliyuniae]
MKMSEELEAQFIKQINREYESSFLYRQLAIEMEVRDLPGMASWLRAQSAEELTHADRLITHLTDRDNHPVIGDITIPSIKVEKVEDVFEIALDAERAVSEGVRDLYRQAEDERDLDSRPTIDWFISEQVEEEATVSEILGRLRIVDGDGSGVLRIDAELASSGV